MQIIAILHKKSPKLVEEFYNGPEKKGKTNEIILNKTLCYLKPIEYKLQAIITSLSDSCTTVPARFCHFYVIVGQ